MKLLLCLLVSFCFAGHARAVELPKDMPQFATHWLQVCQMFLDHEGETMLDLLSSDPVAVDQIGNLWRRKAFRETIEYQKHLQETYVAQKGRTLEEKAEAYSKDLDWMLMSYYFDHAKEIEAMIQMRLKKAQANKTK